MENTRIPPTIPTITKLDSLLALRAISCSCVPDSVAAAASAPMAADPDRVVPLLTYVVALISVNPGELTVPAPSTSLCPEGSLGLREVDWELAV
jgi:hypothetical protein